MEKQTFSIYCVSLFSADSRYSEIFGLYWSRWLWHPIHDEYPLFAVRAVLDVAAKKLLCVEREFDFMTMGVGHEGTCVAIHTTAPHMDNLKVKFYTQIPTPGTSPLKAERHSQNNIYTGLFHKPCLPKLLFHKERPIKWPF